MSVVFLVCLAGAGPALTSTQPGSATFSTGTAIRLSAPMGGT